jgi:hypothetical protein
MIKTFRAFLKEDMDKIPPRSPNPNHLINVDHNVENVPIHWLRKLPGNASRKNEDQMQELSHSIKKEGMREPLIINVGKESRTAKLGEGNHRLRALHRAGYTHAPTRVIVGREYGKEHGSSADYHHDLVPKKGEYFKGDARPSEVFHSLKNSTK